MPSGIYQREPKSKKKSTKTSELPSLTKQLQEKFGTEGALQVLKQAVKAKIIVKLK
jgi:hypothetical protein